ncbi:spermidine synthase [Arenicella xantha]|uniref:Spermidine synthase n=1 Tax=Arenicella xantha TaxID=644221 RepID=A0A395JRT9_9GAMM|nr:spermidine synthase [Arenicella xantha]RBP51410.1 hypothetical protein DFR28_102837 [Arenicella xantha]
MSLIFEEIDFQKTPLGDISLRRRTEPRLDNKLIYEVKLGEEFLMSSLFVEAEEQLSELGLAKLHENGHDDPLDIIVGGLGLGYTALKALQDDSVGKLRVIDVMAPVIQWHRDAVLPIGDVLAAHARCELVLGDFFEIATDQHVGFQDDLQVHAVLLDIDHSPQHWLNDSNAAFYTEESLQKVANKILSGGVFGLWSNDVPDQAFIDRLNQVFAYTDAHLITFDNPYSGGVSTNSVYICTVN